MDKLTQNKQKMVALLDKLATGEGIQPTALDGVKLMRVNCSLPRMPVLYEPSIVIVGRGRKHGHVGGQNFIYDSNNYLVLSLPMPFECETQAGEDGPFVGFSVRFDLPTIGELLMKMEQKPAFDAAEEPFSAYATPLDEELSDVAVRLLDCLKNREETQILGPQLMRELTYRVLCGPRGSALRALISMNSRMNDIHRAVQKMHSQYDQQIDIATLAASVGMSASSFHHAFKTVTGTSPLQYMKNLRLHRAKALIVHEGLGASEAAERVGYESASQFSREFKRFFGDSPLQQAQKERALLGVR